MCTCCCSACSRATLPSSSSRPVRNRILSYAHEPPIEVEAPHLAEMVRRDALERLGNDAMTDGYTVHTTLDSRTHDTANQALRDDLVAYDQRHTRARAASN